MRGVDHSKVVNAARSKALQALNMSLKVCRASTLNLAIATLTIKLIYLTYDFHPVIISFSVFFILFILKNNITYLNMHCLCGLDMYACYIYIFIFLHYKVKLRVRPISIIWINCQ